MEGKKYKILLCEDDTNLGMVLKNYLELNDYDVILERDGRLGLAAFQREKFDICLLDVMMPNMDGFTLAEEIRDIDPDIPLFFLSAKTMKEDIIQGYKLGADDYITKPFDTTGLLNAIESRLRKAEQLKEALPANLNGLHFLMNAAKNNEIQESMSDGRNIHHYIKKQDIYLEGQLPTSLYYIVKGKVRTYKRNEAGKELVIGLYDEGDFLGYTALLEQRPYKENADVWEDVALLTIPQKDFEALFFSDPRVMHKFVQLLSAHVTEKEEQLLGIAYNSLRKKVATAILSLYKKYNAFDNEGYSIDISRDNLAALTGVAKESLIRTLGDFRDEHLIEIKKEGQIFITDLKRLDCMIN